MYTNNNRELKSEIKPSQTNNFLHLPSDES